MISNKAHEIIKLHNKLASRTNWESHWLEVAEYVSPNKDNIYRYSRTPGEKKFNELYDATGVHSNELLASALHSMLTNPSVPWFGLTTGDNRLDNLDEVRVWTQESVRLMHNIFNNSNFQTEIHEVYLDLCSVGTACIRTEEDDDDILRFHTDHISQVFVKENHKGIIDCVTREFKMTVQQIMDKWGEDSLKEVFKSKSTLDMHQELDVIHAVGPRREYDPSKLNVGNKPFYSYYVLKAHGVILSEGGFDEFPYSVPRWTKISGEIYGRSPAMKALPDIKMINQMMKVTLRAAQKVVDPPLLLPDDGVVLPFRSSPGAINYYRAGSGDQIRPLETGSRIDFGYQVMEDVRTRIRSAFFIDQLQLREGPQMTATEVMQRTEEQLRLLAPVLGRLHHELLAPLIDRCFGILYRKNILPQAPEVLQGRKVDVQFSSMIARAQKTAELEGINRFISFASPMLQVDPQAVDNLNADEAVRYIANKLDLPHEFLRKSNEVKRTREQRAQAQQEAMQQQKQLNEAEVVNKVAPAL